MLIYIPLALQYISCAIEAPVWNGFGDVTANTYGYVQFNGDSTPNEINDTSMLPIIDLDGLQLEEGDDDSDTTDINEGLKLIALFLNAYCADNDGLTFCKTYNHCKNKSTCNTNEFLDVNANFISTLMSKITNIDDTHKLIELTDKMHDWTKFALVGVIVILKVIISYLLERKFNLCGKLKTKMKDRKKNSDYVVGSDECESDGEELKIMVSKPPTPLPVHASETASKEPVYDVPKITPTHIALPPTVVKDSSSLSPPDKPPRAP